MRARSKTNVRVDLLQGQQEVAEVSKFATRYGYQAVIAPSRENSSWEASLTSLQESWLEEDLANLVLLAAMSDKKSPNEVLDRIQSTMKNVLKVDVEAVPGSPEGTKAP